MLVREGHVKPSSELAPFVFHNLLPRVRPYCRNIVRTCCPYPSDGAGHLLYHGDQQRGKDEAYEEGDQGELDVGITEAEMGHH